MDPEEWTMGDMIAAWVFMAVPIAAGLSMGRLLNFLRTKDHDHREL